MSNFSRDVSLRGSLCLAGCVPGAPLAPCDQAPSGAPIVGLREAAKHRGPIEPVRSLAEFTQRMDKSTCGITLTRMVWSLKRARSARRRFTAARLRRQQAPFDTFHFRPTAARQMLGFRMRSRLLPIEKLPAETVPFPQGPFKDVKIEAFRDPGVSAPVRFTEFPSTVTAASHTRGRTSSLSRGYIIHRSRLPRLRLCWSDFPMPTSLPCKAVTERARPTYQPTA